VYAAVVVLAFPSLEVIETVTIKDRLSFPYLPGLLSFREAPALLRAFSKLNAEPDLIFIDGHGIAHPRAAGIACHMGVLLDCPVIGCAKSRLYGDHDQPADRRASFAYMGDRDGRTIGAVVRTRDRVRPVYVSIGHKIGCRLAQDLPQ
jgi:deoxyribonuclease V